MAASSTSTYLNLSIISINDTKANLYRGKEQGHVMPFVRSPSQVLNPKYGHADHLASSVCDD